MNVLNAKKQWYCRYVLIFVLFFWVSTTIISAGNFSSQARDKVLILVEGQVSMGTHMERYYIKNRRSEVIEAYSCYFRSAAEECNEKEMPPAKKNVTIDNDVILVWVANHYYHFAMESLMQIGFLHKYGAFDLFPNATVLISGNKPDTSSRNFSHMFGITFPSNIVVGQQLTNYMVTPDHVLIVPPKEPYFQTPETASYLRGRLPSSPHPPNRIMYVTRGATVSRHVINDTDFQIALKKLIPSIEIMADPGHLSVYSQYELFRDARLIIAPHGAALTNLCFAPANVTLIELSGDKHRGTYGTTTRVFGQLRQHKVIHCPNDHKLHLIVNITEVTGLIRDFLSSNANTRDLLADV